jgi:hypothetical protein
LSSSPPKGNVLVQLTRRRLQVMKLTPSHRHRPCQHPRIAMSGASLYSGSWSPMIFSLPLFFQSCNLCLSIFQVALRSGSKAARCFAPPDLIGFYVLLAQASPTIFSVPFFFQSCNLCLSIFHVALWPGSKGARCFAPPDLIEFYMLLAQASSI